MVSTISIRKIIKLIFKIPTKWPKLFEYVRLLTDHDAAGHGHPNVHAPVPKSVHCPPRPRAFGRLLAALMNISTINIRKGIKLTVTKPTKLPKLLEYVGLLTDHDAAGHSHAYVHAPVPERVRRPPRPRAFRRLLATGVHDAAADHQH
jgi:hypothetical protein